MERSDSDNSGENARKRRRRRQPLRSLGVELPEWEDESHAPPVEEERIGELLAGQLEREEFRRIADLVLRFRSWAEAYCRLGRERDQRLDNTNG